MTVSLSFRADGAPRETIGRAVNISQFGMGLEVSREFSRHAELSLRFILTRERHRIQTVGRVQWVRQYADDHFVIGVEFRDLTATDSDILKSFVYSGLQPPGERRQSCYEAEQAAPPPTIGR